MQSHVPFNNHNTKSVLLNILMILIFICLIQVLPYFFNSYELECNLVDLFGLKRWSLIYYLSDFFVYNLYKFGGLFYILAFYFVYVVIKMIRNRRRVYKHHFYFLAPICLVIIVNYFFHVRSIESAQKLLDNNTYDLRTINNKLIYVDWVDQNISAYENNKHSVIYSCQGDGLSGYISLDKQNNLLFIVDRNRSVPDKSALVQINLYNNSSKILARGLFFNRGGSYIVHDDSNIYVGSECDFRIFKINRNDLQITQSDDLANNTESVAFYLDNINRTILISNWIIGSYFDNYFVIVINKDTLKVLRKVLAVGPVVKIIKVNNNLGNVISYNKNFIFYPYGYFNIYQADNNKVVKSIKLPIGLKTAAFDRKKGYLFVGNFLNNNVYIINLNNNKVIKTFRAGDALLREIELDPEINICYISTKQNGLYFFKY